MNKDSINNAIFFGIITSILFGCSNGPTIRKIQPTLVTEASPNDTDDPAIWINKNAPEKSLILGTDKGDTSGGIFVYDLKGNIIRDKCITELPRPNNIDVEYGFMLGNEIIDLAVFTQRNGDNVRVIRLPDMNYVDDGGIKVFEGEEHKSPMGVALYKDPSTHKIYAFFSRKFGPDGSYLWQYELQDSNGIISMNMVRKFGAFKGGREIESIAVDDELGYIYYSDEGSAVRKYYAHPDSSTSELASFGISGFHEDHEGISIYTINGGKGYILVSDQQGNTFHVFKREGEKSNLHLHKEIAILNLSTNESDGSEVSSSPLGSQFPNGLFVAMSDDKTFQIYDWRQIEKEISNQLKE